MRLTLWYVTLLGLMLVLFSVFLYSSLSRNLRNTIDAAVQAQAGQFLQTLDDTQPTLTDAGDQIAPDMLVSLYDRTGTRLIGGEARRMIPDTSAALALAAQGRQTLQTVTLVGDADARRLTVPVIRNGHTIAILVVVRPERDVAAALHNLLLLMAVAVPLTLVLAVAGGLFLAGRALNPIERITTAAARIGVHDLSERIGFQGHGDEVARLASTFDHMLARLEAAFWRQRQFTADASHELRTPLAILTSQVDLALERPRAVADYHELLTSIREDAGRMDQLLGQLLTLARADAGQSSIAPEHLSLRNLVDDVVIAMQSLAEQQGVGLSVDPAAEEEVAIEGDQTGLTQLLMNLIDNGLKYTPAPGTVTITVRRDCQWALVEVADSGIGIPAEDLPHIFERFYRVDQARTRAAGGSGLGLAISQWIVHAHGGEIAVASTPGRGTTVVVRLPLSFSHPAPLLQSQDPLATGTRRLMPRGLLHRRSKE